MDVVLRALLVLCAWLLEAKQVWSSNVTDFARQLAVIPPGHVVGGARQTLIAASVGPITAMNYAAAWDQLFVGGDLGTLQTFRGSDLSLVQGGSVGSRVTAVTHMTTNSGSEVVAGGVDGRMIFLQTSNLQAAATVDENTGGSQVNSIVYISYSDDVTSYSEVATCSYFSSNIILWSANAKTKTRELPGHSNIVLSLSPLPALQMLASGSLDGFLGIWSLPLARLQADGQICTGSTLSPLPTSYLLEDCITAVLSVANPSGGDYFVYGQTGSSSANECQMLENVGTCQSLVAAPYTMYRLQMPLKHMVQAHAGPVRAIEPLPQQGGLIASGGDDGTIRSWSPSLGNLVQEFGDGQRALDSGVTALAYSNSLDSLVAATLLQIAFFDVSTGTILRTIDRSTSSPALLLKMESHGLILTSKGTEIEAWPKLTLCADGSAPSSFSQCEACSPGTAGVGGSCNEVCSPGTRSTGTECVQCVAGQAGDGAICRDCLPGEFQELPGQISCQMCPRGFAQPSSRQTSCEECTGNTASTRQGSEVCVACPDSTEPSVDHTECITCLQGFAGTGGVCQACGDGQQTSADSTTCLDCPPGTAGTQGFCSLCAGGTEPNTARTLCEPCAPGFAGALGICARCPAGEEPDAASALCVPCLLGTAGLNGTCSLCPVGMVQSADRSICVFCPQGEIATEGRCEICSDGTMPNDNRSICLSCPPGYAGTMGRCAICPEGTGASVDHASCDECPEGFYGTEGFCSQCANGTEPRNVSEVEVNSTDFCAACPSRFAGTFGVCRKCPDGSEPNLERSSCQPCPIGSAGVDGECHPCDFPLMQDENKTSCTEQLTSPLFLFAASSCTDHSCRQHFAHLAVDNLFCCPTPAGVSLSCCDFMEQDITGVSGLLSQGFSFVMTLSDSIVVIAAAGATSQCIFALVLCRIWKSSSWLDWRENVQVSLLGLILSLLLLSVMVASFPWILGTMLAFFSVAFLVAFGVFAGMHNLLLRLLSGFQPMLRTIATKRFRVFLFAIGDSIMSSIMLLGDWIIVHFLLADLVSTVTFLAGQDSFLRPMAYEYVITTLPIPDFVRSITMLVVRLLWSMQVSLSSLPMQVAIQATPAAGIMAAASLTYTTTSFCYILMSADLAARLTAAKHAVMVGDLGLLGQVYRLFIMGFLEFLLHVLLRFAAAWPARLPPFVAMILLSPPPGVASWREDFIPVALALFCAVTAEIFVCCTWLWLVGSRRQSTHLGNPPHFLVTCLRRISRDPKLHFEESRAEEYLVCGVLSVLGLWNKEEDIDGPPSAVNSPRSPRSGGRSPVSSHTGRSSGGRNLESSRSGTGVKLKKNLASVTALLRRATGSGSPNSSPRGASTNSSPRVGFNGAPAAARVARLADGSLVDLNQRAREARSARSPGRSPRSPGRGDSPRSPGRTRGRPDPKLPEPDDPTSVTSDPESPAAVQLSRRERCKSFLMKALGYLSQCLKWCCSPLLRRVKKFLPSGPKRTNTMRQLQRAGRVVDRVPQEARKNASGLIDLWEDLAELSGAQVDLTQLAVLPRALYNAVPKPQVRVWLRQAFLRIWDSMKVIAWTIIGWWKQEANLGPLRVRLRCRELIKEVGRGHIDQEDYKAAQISTANSVAILLLWLPGCAVLSLLARYCNAPPVRNLDDTMDIVKQKIQEYVDKGSNYKEAELAVRKQLGERRGGGKLRSVYVARARRLQSFLGMGIASSSMVMVSPLVMAESTVTWAAPIFFTLTFTLVSTYVLLDRVIVPWVAPKKMLMLSVLRETAEEIGVMNDILETFRNMPKEEEEASSQDGDESSDYSSANESFLDEDPKSSNDPDVLGSKQVKILVRPKAARLRMHFELMRSVPLCGEHMLRYQREEPLKYGRLLRVPGLLPAVRQKAARTTRARYTRRTLAQVQPKSAAREARSYSFSPTLGSDTQHKEEKFRLRRCHSTGTGVAFEGKVEERMLRDHWEMHADVFDEKSRPGLPTMPRVDEKMPHRGLVDQFEAVGTFKVQAETKTIRELASKGLFSDTNFGDRMMKAFTAVTGIETRGGPDPWQLPVDEALDGYERQLQVSEAQSTWPREEEEVAAMDDDDENSDQSAEG